MLKIIHLKNDIRQIMRDSVMVTLMMAPLLVIVVFKLMLVFLVPVVESKTTLDIALWHPWIMAFVLLLNSGMLGIVTGFMMLDDKDGNISELMSVTPLGRSGYLLNRLSLVSGMSVVYTVFAYFAMGMFRLQPGTVFLLAFLLAVYSAIIGLVLFSGAENKVKGLTFSKALNIFILFAFADLFALKWFTVAAWFFPPYWISALIREELSFFVVAMAAVVHLGWLALFILYYLRKTE
jgi:fluoroquinolone transport system permease protein